MRGVTYLKRVTDFSLERLSEEFKTHARLELAQLELKPTRVWAAVESELTRVSWTHRETRKLSAVKFKTPSLVGGLRAVMSRLRRNLRSTVHHPPVTVKPASSPRLIDTRSRLFTGPGPLPSGEEYDSLAAAMALMGGDLV